MRDGDCRGSDNDTLKGGRIEERENGRDGQEREEERGRQTEWEMGRGQREHKNEEGKWEKYIM